jgi:Cu2+-exporting ATPase
VVFDKTGTLTSGGVVLADVRALDARSLAIAAALGSHSNHPRSRALSAFARCQDQQWRVTHIREEPGLGIEGRLDGKLYRLGRVDWALAPHPGVPASGTVLACEGSGLAVFRFEERLCCSAATAVKALRDSGIDVQILSGDSIAAVQTVARSLSIERYRAELLPGVKVERLADLADKGRKVLMVGDGLNDLPALAAAHVSMAPLTAADLGRNVADFVFLREDLAVIPLAHAVAKKAGKLVRQNFVLAIAYNAIALPIAIAGHVTPLIAALAMSFSSLTVTVNALRLKAGKRGRRSKGTSIEGASGPKL